MGTVILRCFSTRFNDYSVDSLVTDVREIPKSLQMRWLEMGSSRERGHRQFWIEFLLWVDHNSAKVCFD